MHINSILNYIDTLQSMLNIEIKIEYSNLDAIVHIEQDTIESSLSFNNMFNYYEVIRNISKSNTPTNNLDIKSKNEWIK